MQNFFGNSTKKIVVVEKIVDCERTFDIPCSVISLLLTPFILLYF